MRGILGAACIFAAALGGCMMGRRERQRLRQTRLDVLAALRRMGEEIRLARTPMPQLLQAVASDCGGGGGEFFRAAASAARTGDPLAAAWSAAAEDLPLTEEEHRALRELGQAFGGDEERLCRAIALACAVLQRKAGEAEKRRVQEEKCAAALWGCGGCLAVILLM